MTAPSGVVSDVVGVDVRRQGIIAGHERFQHLLLLQFCFVLFLLLRVDAQLLQLFEHIWLLILLVHAREAKA